MKKVIGCLALAAALAVHADLVTNTIVQSTPNKIGMLRVDADGLGGWDISNPVTLPANLIVGKRAGGGSSGEIIHRGLLRFNYDSPVNTGEVIDSVILRIYVSALNNITGTESLSLYYSGTESDGAIAVTEWEKSSYSLAGSYQTSNLTAGAYYDFDVTAFVAGDISGSGIISSFRIEMDGDTGFDSSVATVATRPHVVFDDNSASNVPQLLIITKPIPEPATLGLFAISGVVLLALRRTIRSAKCAE